MTATKPPSSAPLAVSPIEPVVESPRKASLWGRLWRVMIFLAGLTIGAQAGVMMLRDGLTHVPAVLLQAALASLLVILAFIGVARLTALRKTVSDPMLRQVLARESRPSLLLDRHGQVLFANEAYTTLSHRLANGDLLPPTRLLPTHPEMAAAIYRLAEALRRGQAHSEPLTLPAELLGAGVAARMRLTAQPITAADGRSKAELWQFEPLEEAAPVKPPVSFDSLQQATEVLDRAPVGYLSLRADGRLVQINATLAHWLNWDLALFVAGEKAIHDLFICDQLPALTAMMAPDEDASPFSQTSRRFEGYVQRADGARFAATLIHHVDRDVAGQALPSCSIVVPHELDPTVPADSLGVADATASDQADRQAMTLMEAAPIGVALLLKNGEIVASNQRFDQIFSIETSAQQPHSFINLLPSDQQSATLHLLEDVPRADAMLAPLNLALSDGERSVRLHFARAPMGSEAAIAVFALETTEQRNLEAQFAQAQKMQAVGELAGGIAHDFNNVLQGILGFTDLLLVSHRPTDPSFHDLMQIKSNATRAAGLVRQLLAFSRRQTLRPRLMSLNDAVTDVSHLVRRLMGETVPIEIKLGRDLWPVMADPSQFEQAVLNLAVNARDAMPEGGRLAIRTRNVTAADAAIMALAGLADTDLPPADYVVFEIEDSGMGIAPQVMSKIFQPFFTTKEVGKGTGLGLSMVYGFVKQSGGFIFCRSDIGQGTCFTIMLPRLDERQLAEVEAVEPAPVAAVPADLTGAGTILLVEDEDAVRAFAARALSQRGYTVLEAASGIEALDLYADHPDIDLIVSDVVMPEMDGPTMLKELRQLGSSVKVIFVSGYAEEAFAKNLPEGEDFGFLPKPFSLKQLIEAVKTSLAKRR